MAAGVFTPYSTVSPFSGTAPGGIPAADVERIQSYQTYEEIYWSAPGTFKLVFRGTENKPIYLPSGRVIVETMHRYLAKGFGFIVDPNLGTPANQELAKTSMTALFRRERLASKFQANKRFGLIRGDWLFHVTADDTKPAGTRISINPIDPASYFPVYDDDNLDRIIRIHLMDQFLAADGQTTLVRRQTYEKADNGQIMSSVQTMTLQEAAKENPTFITNEPPKALDARITAFPVYHFPNFDQPGNPFGSSEMRGLEVLMSAMNQSISDEDVTLAMDGIGLYATDSAGPVDDQGNDTDWIIGPGRVVENAANFKRVQGASSLQPYGDHIGRLWEFAQMATGVNETAIGNVDVQVAESGIALALRLGPILNKASEKEDIIKDVAMQWFYDLKTWFAVYEAVNFLDCDVLPTFKSPLPENQAGDVEMAVKMVSSTPPIMSATTAREWLAQKGIYFAADEFQRIVQEAQAAADVAATADPLGQRLAAEDQGTGSASADGAQNVQQP